MHFSESSKGGPGEDLPLVSSIDCSLKATQQPKVVPAKKRPATPSFAAAADDAEEFDSMSMSKRSCSLT